MSTKITGTTNTDRWEPTFHIREYSKRLNDNDLPSTPSRKIYQNDLKARNVYLSNTELVVNKEPDTPLKVNVDYNTPSVYIQMKIDNLEKMTAAMERLENIAEEDKVNFEEKLKKRKKKVMKLKELIAVEEYERE